MKKFRIVHPGEVIRQNYLAPFEISASRLARAMKVPANRVAQILNGRRGISADTALRLARVFEVSAYFWLSLQASFELQTAERKLGARLKVIKLIDPDKVLAS